ncbi:hypothetical protein P4O66_005246 [Electrophorus voltai]|uniref:Uncharacterized protein n=1 Tax=Electrophorus voltai TaxID=2609070 RepID=A0AAD8ZXC3_9TELE|nr:hypothetical protein P4O66_005246 [Electrophorus voltai]
MSGAKDRMRHKKMRNQPSNVTYSSSTDWRNGGAAGGRSHDAPQHVRGPPQYGRPQQSGGWVRGRQDGVPPDQALPKYITASLFARARAAEVSAMMRAVSKTTASCHAFGALPKHMRRRAMSHNTKRLPCRLREAARRALEKSQKAGQKEKREQSKTKSRRARRRHGNLLLEFNRRQRKNKWLETHIWHAKRFHMLKTWGYCLGDRPTYKCYRASYRAMSSGCLMQDLSYHCCVELRGPEEELLRALSRLTSKDVGPTFAGALHVSGQKEGHVMLYRPDRYPRHPLGPAHFLWRPCSAPSSHRQLWVWVHPTLKQDLLSELQAVCECFVAVAPAVDTVPLEPQTEAEPSSHTSLAASEPRRPGGKRKRKREGDGNDGRPAKKVLGDGTRSPLTPVSWASSKTEIVISDLTMEIVRYRLIGPLSHSVLTETLLPATGVEVDDKMAASPFWWPEVCKNEEHMTLHQRQADIFHLLRGVYSTSELPAGCVLGLTVDDPRLTLPKKRGKVTPDLQGDQDEPGSNPGRAHISHPSSHAEHIHRLPASASLTSVSFIFAPMEWTEMTGMTLPGIDEERMRHLTMRGIPAFCAQSALWDQSVRENVTHNKISEQDLNRMKRGLLVPGSRLPTSPQGRVPVLLVHQAGRQQGEDQPGWGSGWDVLLPKAWGMAFWVPLVGTVFLLGSLRLGLVASPCSVYRGVRTGGLQMSLKHSQFKGMPHFPQDYPDCPAGARFQEQQEAELLEKFKRRPPSKRTNYIKHGSLAPFRCPWQQLAEEWEEIVKQDREIVDSQPIKMEGVTSLSGVSTRLTSAFTVLRYHSSCVFMLCCLKKTLRP